MDYEIIREVIPSISLACLYHAYGKLDKFLSSGNPVATEDFCMMYYELLDVSADMVCAGYNDDYGTEKWYFSFYSMMEYYRLCRDYCSQYRVSLNCNPFMREAEKAVDQIMDLGYGYGYGYTLHTKINHDWASGIALRTDEYYNAHYEMLEALLALDDWFRDGVERLKKELNAGAVIPFPTAAEQKEAA